jgi:hypothetical protein
MPTDIQQLWRENSDSTVIGWEGLIELGHFAANARKLFHHVYLDAHFSQVQGRLNTGYSTADYQNVVTHNTPLMD